MATLVEMEMIATTEPVAEVGTATSVLEILTYHPFQTLIASATCYHPMVSEVQFPIPLVLVQLLSLKKPKSLFQTHHSLNSATATAANVLNQPMHPEEPN